MRLLSGRIMARMTRPGGQASEAKPTQHCPNAALSKMHTEPLVDQPRQVDPSPAHDAMLGKACAVADPSRHFLGLLG